jgi:photosystem II stability/assembly factor-like uncharacterized protein
VTRPVLDKPLIGNYSSLNTVWKMDQPLVYPFMKKLFFSIGMAVLLSIWTQLATAQPYVWRAVAMGGGGFVDGIIFHPTAANLMYARTDVGGAYRWDDQKQEWIPLTDWLSYAQGNFTGIESIALDPADAGRVYLAAGTYPSGPAAILRSTDQGRTFQFSVAPFHMGGNSDGRSNGERLAVDPNDGTILFFGSRREGLWKSTDHAATWTRVESFPNLDTPPPAAPPANVPPGGGRRGALGGNQSIGIISVVFAAATGRPGAPTPVIYAAVSTPGTNLFRSDDAGASWQPVAGQPVGLRPSHLIQAADGLLYLTYGSSAGPNNVSNGALWKYRPQDGIWTDISPEQGAGRHLAWGYGAVCVDAHHPATIMATSIDRWGPHDEVFRSTDGGATWRGILLNGRMDYSQAPYTRRMTPHWTGSLAVNPNNPDQVLFGTGYGIWCCTNATGTDAGGRANWIFLDKGLEETVPLALLSPASGAHLISGVGDIDGFRSDDVDVSPPQGTFAGPRFSTTQALAMAGSRPALMVRIGNSGRGGHAALSEDGGSIWRLLANDPPGGNGQGRLAMSADGTAIVWFLQRDAAYVTTDRGATWNRCQGFAGGTVIADPVNPACFYALDSANGRLLTSTNGAVSFAPTGAALPAGQGNFGRGGGDVLAATTGLPGDLWIGRRNRGLFHSTDGGASFSKINTVDGVDALGFGKAAPGQDFPAVYLLGVINGRHARYRSDDAGRTWVRIDDDQHQFATANVPLIIGDPRIYGRVYITTSGRGVIYGDLNPTAQGK